MRTLQFMPALPNEFVTFGYFKFRTKNKLLVDYAWGHRPFFVMNQVVARFSSTESHI